MSAAVQNVSATAAASGSAASISLTVANTNDLILILYTASASNHYASAVSDTFGSTLTNSVLGTFGASSSLYLGSGATYYVGAIYGYAAGSGSDTISLTWANSQGAGPSIFAQAVDISGIAASGALVSNIVNYQSPSGTNVTLTVSGGSGSDTVGSAPSLLVAWGWSIGVSNTWTAGTGFTTNFPSSGSSIVGVESELVNSTGTYDATFTSGGASGTNHYYLWQFALLQAASAPTQNQVFFNRRNVLYFI